MGKNNKKAENQKSLEDNLLDLANSNDENQGKNLEVPNTNLTFPAFEDKEAQDSWEKLAKSPVKTLISPFLVESLSSANGPVISHEMKKATGINSSEIGIGKINRGNPGASGFGLIKKSDSLQGSNNIINDQLNREKQPISNVETIAVTILQKAIGESHGEQVSAAPKAVKDHNLKVQNLNNEPLKKDAPSSSDTWRENDQKLGHIEQVRIAQNRISQLEKELESIRWDNEKLGSAAILLKKKCEEVSGEKQKLQFRFENIEKKYNEDCKILKLKVDKKRDENRELITKLDEMESRLAQDVRRVGSRERDLENRLELVKMEKIALVAGKDEIILNLKRELDHLQFEVEGYRKKTLDLQKIIETNDEQIRRTVRALRLALTNLEVNEDTKGSKNNE